MDRPGRRTVVYRVEIRREHALGTPSGTQGQGAKEWAFEMEAELGRRLFSVAPDRAQDGEVGGIRSKIPWQELPMTAEECAELFAITADHFLRTVACKPTFPVRLTRKPATWKAGEVIEWRDSHRFG